ncbi:MAG TPA: ABC transporter ATP-binding protein, partial [Spirochaetota bacterium]|nr:ABC transporter ATP-binding protein [Spirochaetota bacterium]
GLTGPIGCGKTTLCQILTGLIKIKKGQVFINGIDITKIAEENIFQNIAYIPQKTFLFSDTILNNIALGGKPDLKKIKKAAATAALRREIENLPSGFYETIGENGITLSGGQRQRTAIARGIRKEAELLIFDDALSSVDADTERRIINNMQNLHQKKSMLLISHRISSLRIADRILVMDKGKIIARGTHQKLLRQNSLYNKLARLQQLSREMEGK